MNQLSETAIIDLNIWYVFTYIWKDYLKLDSPN